MTNPDTLRTKKEAARSLSISVRHLENLISARALAVIRLGRSVRIELRELERLKAARTVNAID